MMSARRWAIVPVVVGALAGNVALAGAKEPAPARTTAPSSDTPVDPTPATGPGISPASEATPTPSPSPDGGTGDRPGPTAAGTLVYITTITTTTTIVNAPIIVVAAPITTTTTTNNTTNSASTNSSSTSTAAGNGSTLRPPGAGVDAPQRLELDLRGCSRRVPGAPVARHARTRSVVRLSEVRLGRNATLVVRVNRRGVATLRVPTNASGTDSVPLQVRLAANGMLTIQRPSGLVLQVQGCTPS
jgi:hypothetical protein